MSGGIDSSAAAIILLEKGYEVIGISFKFFESKIGVKQTKQTKSNDLSDASQLCKTLHIPHYIVDCSKNFYTDVVNYFITGYLSGQTPFPCIVCNNKLKWPMLIQKAAELDCAYISTGHYVSIIVKNNRYYIAKGIDPDKDQSFFLWGLNQNILKKTVFPLGNYYKKNVRNIVERYSPKLVEKKESTGICFLKDKDYRPFLKQYITKNNIPITSGYFTDINDNIIGTHEGYPFYTIGQRRGLNLNINKAYYVNKIIPHTNKVVLGNKQSLYKSEFKVENYNIIRQEDLAEKVTVKIRYRKQESTGKITFIDDNKLIVNLNEPVDSIAPGQIAVFYKKNIVLGGGFINSNL